MRRSLLEAPEKFERALAMVRAHYPDGAPMFENAILDVFFDQDECQCGDYFAFDDSRFQNFLNAFRGSSGTARLFTLNQDLYVERRCANFGGVVSPGVDGVQFANWKEPLTTRQGILVAPEPNVLLAEGSLNYVKLHGSFNWRVESGNALLVAGGEKIDQIARNPLLAEYLHLFEQSCVAGDTWLVVAGYSFGDEHINQAISKGTEKGLRLVIMDPRSPAALRTSPGLVQRPEIWDALVGYCSTPLLSLLSGLPGAEQVLQNCLGPHPPNGEPKLTDTVVALARS